METRTIPTSLGEARAIVEAATRPRASLVLGHGAGGGVEAPDLVSLAAALPADGVTVVRVEQPWRVAGKRVAPAPARLDVAWQAVLAALRPDLPGLLVVGGRSAGARVACRTAAGLGAAGVVALAFPLHPPGRPDRSRLDELLSAGVPTLVVQGERDAFGGPGEFPADLPGTQVRGIPAADHSFAVRRSGSPQSALDAVVGAVRPWIAALRAGRR